VIIGLVGDLEGDRDWAVNRLRALGGRGDVEVACQLGDLRFGMGEHHQEYLAAIESVCAEHDLRLLCIGGNHENWALLDRLSAQPRWQDDDGSPKPIDVSDHVTMLPRGHRWELGGRSFVALGGAPSVNRHVLTEGVDWWPSEVILDEHVAATIAGGHAEVMLTHDSPGPPYCTAPVADIIRIAMRVASQPASAARSGSPAPRFWPTSAAAAVEKPMPGRNERAVMRTPMKYAATAEVPYDDANTR